ncbi:hypothetical protein BpHYR1_019700, partial [Brachionus plicatilis]
APVGFATEVKITRQLSEKLSQPYGNCLTDLTRSNPKKTSTMETMFSRLGVKQYSKEMCMNVCFQIRLEMECNCSEPVIPSYQNISKCSDTNECNDECPTECVLYKYSTKLTSETVEISTEDNKKIKPEKIKLIDDFLEKINLYDSIEALRKDVLLIQFYYDDTSITKITERPVWSPFSILSITKQNKKLAITTYFFVGISILIFFHGRAYKNAIKLTRQKKVEISQKFIDVKYSGVPDLVIYDNILPNYFNFLDIFFFT